jgi:hypothetical protein
MPIIEFSPIKDFFSHIYSYNGQDEMKIQYVRALLPIVVGHMILNRCVAPEKTDEPASNTVRGYMWPILLVFMGMGWELSTGKLDTDMGYTVLLATLCLWFWLWCQRQSSEEASMVLILVAVSTAVTIWVSAKNNPRASLFLVPLFAWVILAERLRLPRIKITLPQIRLPKISISGPAVIRGPEIDVK